MIPVLEDYDTCNRYFYIPCVLYFQGLTWKEAQEQCPPGVVPACHNAEDTVTISGPSDAVKLFVSDLKARDIFAKEVNSAGVAFHSYYMKGIAPALKNALDKVGQA